MSTLPLAHVSRVIAIQHGHTLYLAATGTVSGFDGTLEIRQSPARICPPLFEVFSIPGNCGITGECVEREVTTAKAFPGVFREIQVRTADGTLHPVVHSIREALPTPIVAAAEVEEPEPEHAGWSAWENRMPGSTPTLHVLGRVMMPTPGYTLELVRANPQGINPNVLILDLVITPPEGIMAQVLKLTEVRYTEEAVVSYSHVFVRGVDETIPVQIVW